MDSLLLTLLLLGGAQDGLLVEAPRTESRVQAVASARILRGAEIDFDKPLDRRSRQAAIDSSNIFQIAPDRSMGEIDSPDGRQIHLQEFY